MIKWPRLAERFMAPPIDYEQVAHMTGFIGHLREVADNPDLSEGALRNHLRHSATAVESLTTTMIDHAHASRRLSKRLMILAALFMWLLVWQLLVGFRVIDLCGQ